MSTDLHVYVASRLSIDKIVTAPTKEWAADMVYTLMTCHDHGGAHHFAVVNEGRSIGMSRTAVACLESYGYETDES